MGVATDELDRVRERTRAHLLKILGPHDATVRAVSGTVYTLKVLCFLDSVDPDSDLFVQIRARPVGARLRRPAKAGFLVDAESLLWHRGEIVGQLPMESN